MIKNIHTYILLSLLITGTVQSDLFAQQQPIGSNPYTYAPQFFDAHDGSIGRYWAGNKKYPAKAFIGEDEFTKIVVIKKNQLELKANKKLKKNKTYLGFYIDQKNNQEYYLYGLLKNPKPLDDGPDSDVITQIAIKQDYGIGE